MWDWWRQARVTQIRPNDWIQKEIKMLFHAFAFWEIKKKARLSQKDFSLDFHSVCARSGVKSPSLLWLNVKCCVQWKQSMYKALIRFFSILKAFLRAHTHTHILSQKRQMRSPIYAILAQDIWINFTFFPSIFSSTFNSAWLSHANLNSVNSFRNLEQMHGKYCNIRI